jgi:cell division septum initiation protein DivIVA
MVVGVQGAVAFWTRGIAALGLCASLIGCASDSHEQSSPVASASPSAVAANLLQVCDHVQDAFRDGSPNETEQAKALSAELQGMIDTAEPAAAEVLGPMIDAADAMASAERERDRPALRQAEHHAYNTLRGVCVRAGSQAWGE